MKKRPSLNNIVEGVQSLRGMFITAMPDCLLFDSWIRPREEWEAEDVASYFGDLVRANREGLKALNAWSTEMQVTIESTETLLLLREYDENFIVGFIFDTRAALGMVRLSVKRVLSRLDSLLPNVAPEERPRAVRVVEFVQRYAPDPHASLMRVSLQTGIELDSLEHPESLEPALIPEVERSVCDILGLEELRI
jgi:predicted regulator of Ras-like GTPase activity (Roadblock/LC7/MglB family)